VKYDLITTF